MFISFTKIVALFFLIIINCQCNYAQTNYLLLPDRVFDGEQMREGWGVSISGNKIIKAGPASLFSHLKKIELVMKDGVIYKK